MPVSDFKICYTKNMENSLCKFKICKYGFTLAEVLITLVIIGVVAAMTIPNVISNTRKPEYSARLKKFYSTMKQVELMSAVNGNTWFDWTEANGFTYNQGFSAAQTSSFIKECILPYVSYVKATSDTVYLNDGSSFQIWKGDCFDFIFDVNGEKKPNEMGKDVYKFLFCPKDTFAWINQLTLIPYQKVDMTSRDTLLFQCMHNSQYCSALLMLDGWEYKDDYPYRL